MAGSYQHARSGWSTIENMGDAYETVQELLWLVQEGIGTEKAREMLTTKFYPIKRGEIDPDETFADVDKRMSR